MRKKITIFLFCVTAIFFGLKAQNPLEAGEVNWLRNFEEAKHESKEKNKPIFILFQEIPGCSTCQRYGQEILSHPLIVETIEDFFVPLLIHNNKQGADAEVLAMYKEPAWNNPVVRLVDAEGVNIINRLAGAYSPYDVVHYMINGLIKTQQSIPTYLSLLEEELLMEKLGTKETFFSMYCFWSGEKQIAKQKGVAYTEAGYMDGKEVVKVRYAPDLISYESLLERSEKVQCASGAYSNDHSERKIAAEKLGNTNAQNTKMYRKDKEDKYYLSKSDLQYIPLTDLQKSRTNSMIAERLNPVDILSPRQIKFLSNIDNRPKKSMIGIEFKEAWRQFVENERSE